MKPKKRQLVFSNGTIPPVVKGIQDAFELFCGKVHPEQSFGDDE